MTVRRYRLQAPAPATLRIDYASQLNAEQLAVVEAPAAPVLVIAGAGSGKTRTLVYRLARMLESGIAPEEILLLTFTNRAAWEMLDRSATLVTELPGVDVRRIAGGTFHSVGHRILREHAERLGFERSFGVLDREDQADLLASCAAELGVVVAERRFPKADVVANLLSLSINLQRPLAEVIARRKPQFGPLTEAIERVAERYAERKLELDVMDFDDLLVQWKRLLDRHPPVRKALQDRFRCILVDEYQDTNRLQGELVDRLAAVHRNLTVVGDDAQSIYSFRGADFSNVLEFPARYPECQIHKLTANYRSTPEILALANASIARNVRQYPKELRSVREPGGALPALVPARDAVQQAAFIAQRVLELRDEGIPLQEIAILYRAHAQSMEIQIELSRRGIPFVVRSGARFFQQAHIKDVLAFLRVASNPADELSFKRMVRLFPGIGSGSADGLWRVFREARSAGASVAEALRDPSLAAQTVRKGRAGWERCRGILEELIAPLLQASPSESIHTVLTKAYEEYLYSQYPNADTRLEDLRQLADYALQYPDVGSFLAEVSLLTDLSGEEGTPATEPDEFLTLSSVHQAKGLEWRAVFVVWLADGSFPSGASLRDAEGEEEERRCFYVAITRARDELYLTYPMLSAPRDGERLILRPSRFLTELPEGEVSVEKWSLDEEPQPSTLAPLPRPAAFPGPPVAALPSPDADPDDDLDV
ncbi:MAG TPA: ATP-dependent helicase [Vulgatibacter sp.]|nr:ATP-dependent helicase [Vulgatibacter sp.]